MYEAMAASSSSNDRQQRSSLLEQIARERREVSILESERALLLSQNKSRSTLARKRQRRGVGGGIDGLGSADIGRSYDDAAIPDATDMQDERDLLDVLDALQCRVTLESIVVENKSGLADGDDNTCSSGGTSTNIADERLDDKSGLGEVDAESFRLHPILGGVTFTKVEGPLPPSDSFATSSSSSSAAAAVGNDVNSKRLYVLSGHIIGRPKNSISECIGFEVRAEVSFTRHARSTLSPSKLLSSPRKSGDEERASVSSVTVKCSPHFLEEKSKGKDSADEAFSLPFPTEELSELAQLVAETRSLTKLFRELVAFQEFHHQRTESFKRLIAEFGYDAITISSADTFCIRIGNESMGEKSGLQIKLSWSRSFYELGRDDNLCVEDCSLCCDGGEDDSDGNGQDTSIGSLLEIVMDPDGISSLVHCVGGCESAIRIMLKAVSGQ